MIEPVFLALSASVREDPALKVTEVLMMLHCSASQSLKNEMCPLLNVAPHIIFLIHLGHLSPSSGPMKMPTLECEINCH